MSSPDPGRHPSQNLHVVNNFLRKLFTFVAWAPLPRLPRPDTGSHPSQNPFMLLTCSEGNLSILLPELSRFPLPDPGSHFLKETVHICCLGSSPQMSPSRSRQPPLPKSDHFVQKFLRKLLTFVAWAPPQDFPFQIQEATLPKCR